MVTAVNKFSAKLTVLSNLIMDAMHDFSQCVASFLFKMFCNKIISNSNNKISVDIVNDHVNRFDIGRYDVVNKLSANFTAEMLKNQSSKSKQKPAQSLLFGKVVVLTFIDLISETDPSRECFIEKNVILGPFTESVVSKIVDDTKCEPHANLCVDQTCSNTQLGTCLLLEINERFISCSRNQAHIPTVAFQLLPPSTQLLFKILNHLKL